MNLDFTGIRQHVTFILFVVAIGLVTGCGAIVPSGKGGDTGMNVERAVIEGTATYWERIAMPPEAVFEAVLEDVTIADAMATGIARTTIAHPPNPPIRFSIAFDPVKINPSRIYSVRARILVAGKLWFISDTFQPVLTRGAGWTVDIVLRMVRGGAGEQPQAVGASGPAPAVVGIYEPRLPATFRGDVPCADCEAVRYHLDLWPDQVFHLRREWVGRNLFRDDVGRWSIDPPRKVLILQGREKTPLHFEVKGGNRLRLLDITGAPTASTLPYDLVSDGALSPTDLSLTLGGEMVYLADAARFTECLTGRSYPIAMEGDFVKMERAYLKDVREPGAPLYVTFEGLITDRPHREEGLGTERSVTVRRFISAMPDQACEPPARNPSVANTCWRIIGIKGRRLSPFVGRQEPYLFLRSIDGRRSYGATIGCNQLTGTYMLTGEGIVLTGSAATLMACPPPLDTLEKELEEALARTRRWRVKEGTLEFMDETGAEMVVFGGTGR